MRAFRIAKVVAGAIGPFVGIVKPSVEYMQSRQPMSPLEWFAIVIIVASTIYGVTELALFLSGLNRRVTALERIGTGARLDQMYEWFMDPNDFRLIAARVRYSTRKKRPD